LHLIIDLGHQPPCNALLSKETLQHPEKTYPLRLYHCPQSGLAQLDYVVDGSEIYYPEYPYRSGLSEPLIHYQASFADDVIKRCALADGSLCVDVGSNDGTLLKHFHDRGMRALGVEPTNIAAIARIENGIETIQSFFTASLARDIVRDYGHADVVTMTNVFAHMAPLGDVMRGLCELLANDGVFVTESHYLLDVLEQDQFDTIYHEHLRTYSAKALATLLELYGLELFHVERVTRYAGNIRAYAGRKGRRSIDSSVDALLRLEDTLGLHAPGTWIEFRNRVHRNRDRVMEFMYRERLRGRSVGGYSCPGRASPLLNFFGIHTALLPYIGELPGSLKIGKFVPGVHIPVVGSERIVDEQPDYVVVLAWHYRDVIINRLRREGVKSAIVTLLPTLEISEYS
jgi:SAM-dependent methyltransferase